MGIETIMVNCNPETVSTDYDTSDKLYFEPLTVEDVLSIYEKEKPEGVIVQFGGQTPLNISRELEDAGVKILGTSVDAIDLAEDRDRFRMMMEELDIPMPESGMASNLDQALEVAKRIGYPLMVRPSLRPGGRGMEVIYDEEMLERYVAAAVDVTPEKAHSHRPIPRECSGDGGRCPLRPAKRPCARSDGAYRAGGHSFRRFGLRNSASEHLRREHLQTIEEYTAR